MGNVKHARACFLHILHIPHKTIPGFKSVYMKNIGIILAGGSGHRMGSHLPKQFLTLLGKTVLEHSLSAFQLHPDIDEIFIVTHAAYIEKTETIVGQSGFSKVTRILTGGAERYHSTLAALQVCPQAECNLIIHDAVRPLVSQQMITDCIWALEQFAACTTAIPSTDTILVSDATHQYIQDIPTRSFLFNVQTPQAFRKNTLLEVYKTGLQDPAFQPTDDCGVIQKYKPELRIKIVPGHSSNLKITYPEDLITAEKLLSKSQSQ